MAKILIIEPHSDGLLDLALRAQAYGHSVRLFERDYDPIKNPTGRGIVERVPDWRPSVRWADLIVVGSLGYCQAEFDRIQAEGRPIIGAGGQAAQWELDRLAGMQAFKRAGIAVPPYRQCAGLREAMQYVYERDEGVAVKVCGDVTDKSTSVVGKTAKEVLHHLDTWRKQGRSFPSGFIVQDRVQGSEFAVGAWVGPQGFVDGFEENAENKKLFAGDLGPNTGEMGTTLRLVKKSKLADKVLKPFEDRLVSLGYIGNFDVNCIVDDEGTPWPLEFTMRLGYPAINIELALHDNDPVEFLMAVATGNKPPPRKLDTIAVGIVQAIWPYPAKHERTEEVVGQPIWGVTPAIENAIHPVMVQVKDDQLATAGSYVLVSTGLGSTVSEARHQAARVLDRLTIPANSYYRNDIGGRLRGQLPRLQKNGYAIGFAYA